VFQQDSILAADYAARIRNARSGKGWTQKELATKLNERLSIIKQLENGDFHPDNKLIKKIEQLMEISLKEAASSGDDTDPSFIKKGSAGKTYTIADIARNQE